MHAYCKGGVMKKLLIVVLMICLIFQMLAGIWMIVDLGSAASILLGLTSDYDVLSSKEIFILSRIAGKSFIMLGVYTLFSLILILKKSRVGYMLALITGIMISIISVTTYIESQSYLVWITDFSRGFLIVISVLFLKKEWSK